MLSPTTHPCPRLSSCVTFIWLNNYDEIKLVPATKLLYLGLRGTLARLAGQAPWMAGMFWQMQFIPPILIHSTHQGVDKISMNFKFNSCGIPQVACMPFSHVSHLTCMSNLHKSSPHLSSDLPCVSTSYMQFSFIFRTIEFGKLFPKKT